MAFLISSHDYVIGVGILGKRIMEIASNESFAEIFIEYLQPVNAKSRHGTEMRAPACP